MFCKGVRSQEGRRQEAEGRREEKQDLRKDNKSSEGAIRSLALANAICFAELSLTPQHTSGIAEGRDEYKW
ncbi:hypothetical protein [Okeania sp. SIO2B3]|uniref:hypothetical protein n=1 Tax=Okeania sp. SIO2B3 TaxID=2607784 RepID=UPI0013BF1DC5|nr:hypothetical protein [Okeania sp. SIO2B3]NET44332.1 hypothetical protein [Okeania sp. SIO2B3]